MRIIYEKRKRRGLKTPSWDDKPELFADVAWIWDAFFQLHDTRQYRTEKQIRAKGKQRYEVQRCVPQAIPTSEIRDWLEIHGYRDPDVLEEAFELIHELDREFRAWDSAEGNARENATPRH